MYSSTDIHYQENRDKEEILIFQRFFEISNASVFVFFYLSRYLREEHGVGLESKIMPQIRTITKSCFLVIQEVTKQYIQNLLINPEKCMPVFCCCVPHFSGLRVGPSFAFLTALIVAVGPPPTLEDSVSVHVICLFPDP